MKVVADKDIPYLELLLDNATELIRLPGRLINNDSLKEADGLLIRSITLVNEALLRNTEVKWVGSLTAGTDHLDINWLHKKHIAWCTCPGFNAPPVADYVVATIAALINHGKVNPEKARAAIIGVGQVGTLIVDRLTTLGLDITLVDPLRAANEPHFSKTTLSDIDEMDLICLHTPLTKEGRHATYQMINSDFMQRQKPGCVLLNAARGPVIDTEALLTAGSHLLACLDVFEHEPNITLPILNATTIATPHIAGHAIESKWRGAQILTTWLNEQLRRTKNPSSTTFTHPPHIVTTPAHCQSWHAIVQHVFDVIQISNEMRERLTIAKTAQAIQYEFDAIRKKFGNRHEFSNTLLQNIEHVSSDDKNILKKLGFLI